MKLGFSSGGAMSRGRKCVVGPGRRAACGRAAGSRANPRRPGHRRPVRAGLGHRGPPRLDAPDTLHRPPLQSTGRPGSRKPADFARPRNMLAIEPSLPHGSEDRNAGGRDVVRTEIGRSLTGARIETGRASGGAAWRRGRSLTGARIETSRPEGADTANHRRSLTGARIETGSRRWCGRRSRVAPSRERGSKLDVTQTRPLCAESLPHGSEDRNSAS